jgi:hypothetical protein
VENLVFIHRKEHQDRGVTVGCRRRVVALSDSYKDRQYRDLGGQGMFGGGEEMGERERTGTETKYTKMENKHMGRNKQGNKMLGRNGGKKRSPDV